MKITLLRENFAAAVQLAKNAVSTRSPIPALKHIRLRAEDGSNISLLATDLEHAVIARLGARVSQLGDVLLPADMLSSLLGRLTDEKVVLELLVSKGIVRITSGKVVFNIKVLAADEFPAIDDIPSDAGLTLETATFKKALAAVLPCVAGDQARPALTGVYFEFREKLLALAASDGFRLAECTLPAEIPSDWVGQSAIVPSGALHTLIKAVGRAARISIGLEPNRVTFNLTHTGVVGTRLEANFPDYAPLIPKSHKLQATFESAALLGPIKTASIVGGTGIFTFTPGAEVGKLMLTATDPERGDVAVDVDGAIEGEALMLGAHLPYVQTAVAGLTNVGAANIALATQNEKSPIRFTSAADLPKKMTATYVVMPLAIKAPAANGTVTSHPEPVEGQIERGAPPAPAAAPSPGSPVAQSPSHE